MSSDATNLQFDYAKYGFRNEENYLFKAPKGLNEQVVRELSGMKGEPEWMLKQRLKALAIFNKKPVMPSCGAVFSTTSVFPTGKPWSRSLMSTTRTSSQIWLKRLWRSFMAFARFRG